MPHDMLRQRGAIALRCFSRRSAPLTPMSARALSRCRDDSELRAADDDVTLRAAMVIDEYEVCWRGALLIHDAPCQYAALYMRACRAQRRYDSAVRRAMRDAIAAPHAP